MRRLVYAVVVLAILTGSASQILAEDWSQAAANPARTAHVSDQPGSPIKMIWAKRIGDEILRNTNQPIIIDNVIYIGSENGVVHAVRPEDGKELWSTELGGAVMHCLAGNDERIFAAAMDGCIYALDRDSGRIEWKSELSRRGFSVGLLLMDDKLFAGNRNGIFYAVSAKKGRELWSVTTGAPIEQTAAGSNGKVVFTNKAMDVWCLEAEKGDQLWKKKIIGSSVRDYWPVIFRDKVLIRTRQAGPRDMSGNCNELQNRYFFPARYGEIKEEEIKFKADTKEDILKEQNYFVSYFEKNPMAHTFAALRLSDGSKAYTPSVVAGCCNTGAIPPPAAAGDGRLYTPFPTSAAHRGIINITRLGLGHFNIETGKIDEPLICGGGEGVAEVIGTSTPFELTSDETVCLSSGGNVLVGIRAGCEPGAINVETRKRIPVQNMRILPRSDDMLPSGNVIAISGKYLAFVKNEHLVCLKSN